jgi:hypothetical protein
MVAHGITLILPIAGQKFPQYSKGNLENFAVFQDVDVFITRFVAEPQLIICGIAACPEPSLGNIGLLHGSPPPGPFRFHYAARSHLYKLYIKN